ncbi:MAG TPA: hypothetical protein GX708_09130 [Gallicola sp.]|nr:hypothetical protein [Gallicola sp.]HNY45301.1 hypothetical protein [Bacteroidales bacterium]
MKNLFYLITITLLLASCSSPLDKPIVEPLTVEELRSVSEKDTSFIEFYEGIQNFRQSFFAEDINQVKYGDISYNQLRDYIEYRSDTTFTKPIIEKSTEEWNNKFGDYEHKLDSIKNYWQNYLDENSLMSYVDIEFDHIDKDYYSYNNDVKNVNLALKLTPLKGTIQQISFTYKIKSKLLSDESESIYSSILDDNRGSCITTSPFSKSVVRYWEVNYTLEKKLKYMSTAEFKRDYDITFEVSKIRVNNNNISEDDLLVPSVVEDYLNYPSLYEDDVIKYFFNPDYVSYWEYIEKAIDNELKIKDEKCYNFIKAVSDFEND